MLEDRQGGDLEDELAQQLVLGCLSVGTARTDQRR